MEGLDNQLDLDEMSVPVLRRQRVVTNQRICHKQYGETSVVGGV